MIAVPITTAAPNSAWPPAPFRAPPGFAYAPKRPLRPKQAAIFERTKDMPCAAFQMEQQTGKSKPVVDTAARLYMLGQVNALLIIAMPGAAPRNWVEEHVPNDLPDHIPRMCHLWEADEFKLKRTQKALADLCAFQGMAVVAVRGESIITENFRRWLPKFLRARGKNADGTSKVFGCADETGLIMATPNIARTRVMHRIGALLHWKRILDGTMHGENPLAYWAQYYWLDWRILGFPGFWEFKCRYAALEQKHNGATGHSYYDVVGYQHTDELREKVAPFTAYLTRKEANPDQPEKVYMPKCYFDMTDKQAETYQQLEEQYEAELSTGERVTAPMVLVRYLRLQQVASGWWPKRGAWAVCQHCHGDGAVGGNGCAACDGLGAVETELPRVAIDPKRNPRQEALHELLKINRSPAVVMCRFTPDVDICMELLADCGMRPRQFDGRVSDEQKAKNRRAFQDANLCDAVVAHVRSAQRSVTLNRAERVIFYSHDQGLVVRLQAEDRAEAEREGKTRGTGIYDLVARGTVDEKIIESHRAKKGLADQLQGRQGGKWI